MEKNVESGLLVNEGSFMEKFRQLHEEKEKGNNGVLDDSSAGMGLSGSSTPKTIISNSNITKKKTVMPSSSGKLAFSLKQKSKPIAPAIKLCEDEDDEETNVCSNISGDVSIKRQKLGRLHHASEQSPPQQVSVATPSASDPAVKKVADKLASFVAKNGRQFEHVTRQRNPGDTPFKFLFDEGCNDYKYYEYRLIEEEKSLSQVKESQIPRSGGMNASPCMSSGSSQKLYQPHSNYQIPASALHRSGDDTRSSLTSLQADLSGVDNAYGGMNASVCMSTGSSQWSNQHHSNFQTPASALYESGDDRASATSLPTAFPGADPISMMEFYVKKAAQEEKKKQPKKSKDEMPPPASLLGPGGKGHHMGDYIPPEELEKFLATCNDVAAQKAAKEAADRAKIQADNVGHKLLSKMGWREGEGLGSSRKGIADPIMAGDVKKNHLGVGAHNPGEVTPDDDIYEQYKKRMMLGYKHRPNPLNNPRKSYY